MTRRQPRSCIARGLMLAALLVPAGRAAAQGEPRLPACPAGQVEEQPCRTPYDVPPVLSDQPPLPEGGERGTPHVWMLVDETGAVRTTQIGRTAGVEWDLLAVERGKRYRFQPATRGGAPIAAWILVPVPVAPGAQTCADFPMGVPLSAGVATFVDSTVFESADMGTAYRYQSMTGFPLHVFIYPADSHGTAREQVEETILTLRSGGVNQGPDSLAVLSHGRERVRLFENGGGGVASGESARLRLWFGREAAESYVAVFPFEHLFVKIRATHPPDRDGREIRGEFVRQILSHSAWRAQGCPRQSRPR